MSEKRPWLHLFKSSPAYSPVLDRASAAARSDGWDTIDFATPSIARQWLDLSRPDAFVSYLSPRGRDRPEDPVRQQPVLDLIARAQELEIPVALLTPRPPGAAGFDPRAGIDIRIGAALGWRPETFIEPLAEWLGQIAGRTERPQA